MPLISGQIVRRYKTEKQISYCANRNNIIMSDCEAQQWHHIPGKRNPAATRGILLQNVEQLWLQPPEFLLLSKSDWP